MERGREDGERCKRERNREKGGEAGKIDKGMKYKN